MVVLDLTRWPVWLVLTLAGLSAVAFAFVTVNLFSHAMANLSFIAEYGWLALSHGAALQLLELIVWGAIALIVFLTFRATEIELLYRYFRWTDRISGENRTGGRGKTRFRRDGN